MLLLEYNPKIPKTQVSNAGPRGGAEVEHMARITTFIIVFISIFCGWPCLLHFMAGFAKTGVVLSSVTGCLVFQTAVILRALTWIAVHGTKHEFSLHDLTEAVLVTASFHIRYNNTNNLHIGVISKSFILQFFVTSWTHSSFAPSDECCNLSTRTVSDQDSSIEL